METMKLDAKVDDRACFRKIDRRLSETHAQSLQSISLKLQGVFKTNSNACSNSSGTNKPGGKTWDRTFWTTNLWQLHVLSFFTKNTDPLANQNAKINIFYWGKSKRFFVGRTIWEQFTSKTVVTHFTSLLVTESATTERKSRVLQ